MLVKNITYIRLNIKYPFGDLFPSTWSKVQKYKGNFNILKLVLTIQNFCWLFKRVSNLYESNTYGHEIWIVF